MTDLSNVTHCFWQSCAAANHTIASGEHAHILKATDWTSASQPTLKTDDSYLAFSNYDFKLIERNDKHILVGVGELMGIPQRRELLELVYENNRRVISIFFIICLSCTTYTVPLCCSTQQHLRGTWISLCVSALSSGRSANLILNLQRGRGNTWAELSSGGPGTQPRLTRWSGRSAWGSWRETMGFGVGRRERNPGSRRRGEPNRVLLIQLNPLASWKNQLQVNLHWRQKRIS